MNHFQQTVVASAESDPLVRVGESFHRVMHELANCCHETDHRIAGKVGLTRMEARLLTMAAEVEWLLPSEAAREFKLVRSRISLLTNSLLDKGLLVRAESTTDRRNRTLRITAKGKRVAQTMRDEAAVHLRDLVRSVPAVKRQTMLEHLELLYHCATVVNAAHSTEAEDL